jgi:uncharacterized membrane protein YeaQ/YmgE (transglycosylase-associated protein family)
VNVIAFLLIGTFAGWIASSLMRGEGLGIWGDLIVGVIGAFVGGFIFDLAGVAVYGFWSALGMSVIGALIFLFVVGLFTGPFNLRKPLRKY